MESLFSLVEEILFESASTEAAAVAKEMAKIGQEKEDKEKKLKDLEDSQDEDVED